MKPPEKTESMTPAPTADGRGRDLLGLLNGDEGEFAGTQLTHFKVEASLGSGGIGQVYQAHDMSLDRKVAVKILYPSHVQNEELRERFYREARAQASLNNPRSRWITT